MPNVLDPIVYKQDYRPSQWDTMPLAVKNRNLDTFVFNKAVGGTLTLGGVSNGNGVFQLLSNSSIPVITMNNAGMNIYDPTGSAVFTADDSGNLTLTGTVYATAGTFTGTITALAGSIGGFTIATGYLYAGTSTNTCGLSPADYPFWAGDTYANRATAPFRVSTTGAITTPDIDINVSSDGIGGSGADFRYNNASKVIINGSGVAVRNTKGFFMEETTAGNWGSLSIGSDNIMVLKASESTDKIYIEDSGGDTWVKFRKDANNHHITDFQGGSYIIPYHDDADPGSVTSDGGLYYNTSDDTLRVQINGVWKKVDVSAV